MRNDTNAACSSAVEDSCRGELSGKCLVNGKEAQCVLESLTDELSKQLQFAGQDLTQTQQLLTDAIDTLTACFTSIHVHVDSIARDMGQIIADSKAPDEVMTAAVGYISTVSDQLGNDINTAVRVLQFEDIATQLIDHAIHRVSTMNEALSDIKLSLSEAPPETTSYIDQLCRQKEQIFQKLISLDQYKTNPVSQAHMGAGEIELF